MSGQRPRSILIIDDDAISREVLAMTLEMHGYSVTGAEDGNAALAALDAAIGGGVNAATASALPDLILMDAQMPGLSGVELISALRAAGAGRIVAISASEPGEAISAAADGFLLKPIAPEAIAELFLSPAEAAAPMPSAESGSSATLPVDFQIESQIESQIDPAVLAKLKAMMPASAVREIYETTAVDMKTRLLTLEAAMAAANTGEVARIAHSIKGSCAMVGLTRARDAASRLETSNLPVTWPAEVAQFHIALEALEVMLADDFSA